MTSVVSSNVEASPLRHELPEGIGRKPIYSELGEYGQFVFEPKILPSLYRVPNGDDLCHYIFDSGHFQGKTSAHENLQRKIFQRLCSDHVPPIKRLQRKVYSILARFYGSWYVSLLLVPILLIIIFLNKSIIVVAAGGVILLPITFSWFFNKYNNIMAESHTLYANWGAEENPDPNVNTCQNANTTDIVDWFNTFSGDLISISEITKEKIRVAISFFSKSQRGLGDSTIYPFKGLDKAGQEKLSENDRYLLAQLRIEKLWNSNESLVRQYCEWVGWNKKEKEAEKNKDIYLLAGWLNDHLSKKADIDLSNSLSRLISNIDEKQGYHQKMIQDALFWLERPVKQQDNTSNFGVWIAKKIESWDGQLLYLTSEAAMGKSTTMNLLTIAGCKDKLFTQILPIRIKVREVEHRIQSIRNTSDGDFFETIFSSLGDSGKIRNALEYYSSDLNSYKPLLILDGMDELKRENQQILLDRLKNLVNPKFPILITSRPSRLVSPELQPGGIHATLCNLSPLQRMKILQNLEMSAESLESMQDYLSPELIDRPFALMIAAKVLRKSDEFAGVSGGKNNLSIRHICEEYLRQFDAREETKTTLEDTNSLRKKRRTALSIIAQHQIGVMCGEISENIDPNIDEVIERELLSRSQMYQNDRLVDTWLEGYYAASSTSFESKHWNDILNYVDEPGRRSLILRNYCCASPTEQTPNWNALKDNAPEVMHIVSEEWQTMNIEKRIQLLERFGIPSNQEGHIQFIEEHRKLLIKCSLSELLGLLHFHCSIVDSDKWRKGKRDLQWELLFRIFMQRLDEVKDQMVPPVVTTKQRNILEFKEPLVYINKKTRGFISKIFHPNVATFVKKIIPYIKTQGVSNPRSLFCDDANPTSLFRLIDDEICTNSENSNIFLAVGVIELFANRVLFKIRPEVLISNFGIERSDISGRYINMFCSLTGCKFKGNWVVGRKLGWSTFAESLEAMAQKPNTFGKIHFFPSKDIKRVTNLAPIQDGNHAFNIHLSKIIHMRSSLNHSDEFKLSSASRLTLIPSVSPYSLMIDYTQCRFGILVGSAGGICKSPTKWQQMYKGQHVPSSNIALQQVIKKFEALEAKKFQSISFYDNLRMELEKVTKHGKIIGYLFGSKGMSWGRPHRWMYLPGLEDTKIGGLAFELNSPTSRKFEQIFPTETIFDRDNENHKIVSVKDVESNRWYAFDVQFSQDRAGYWNFVPKPSSIQLLCQNCLKETIVLVENNELSCQVCNFRRFLNKSYRSLFKKHSTDDPNWNTQIGKVEIDWDTKIATIFAEKKHHRKYFLGNSDKESGLYHHWLIKGVEKRAKREFGIKQIYVQPSEVQSQITIKEEE